MTRLMTMVMFVLILDPCGAFGAITTYTNKQEWETSAGAHTTITFQEFPSGTWVSDQYADLGIMFDFNADFHSQIQTQPWFLNDGVGLMSLGLSGWPIVRFTKPRYAIAVDTPDSITNFFLYYQGASVGNVDVVSGGYFKGIVSTLPFDTVLALPTSIDDLFFGPPVPAPGVLGLFAVVMLGRRRRRR